MSKQIGQLLLKYGIDKKKNWECNIEKDNVRESEGECKK